MNKDFYPFVYQQKTHMFKNYNPLHYLDGDKQSYAVPKNDGVNINEYRDCNPLKKFVGYGKFLENQQFNYGRGRPSFIDSQTGFSIREGISQKELNALDFSNYYNCRK